MRIGIVCVMAAAAAVAACGQQAGEQSVDGPAKPGDYTVTLQDGTQGRITLRSDATFTLSETPGGPVVREGTWRRNGGQFCLNDNARPREVCMDETATGASGGFTLGARGQVVMRLEPVAGAS